jgi:hypothetical protein
MVEVNQKSFIFSPLVSENASPILVLHLKAALAIYPVE